MFLVVNFLHFAIKQKSQETSSKIFFEKIPKKSSHFEKESNEITKIFGEFGQIFNFICLKLSYLVNRF
jgi:hypothetical protein